MSYDNEYILESIKKNSHPDVRKYLATVIEGIDCGPQKHIENPRPKNLPHALLKTPGSLKQNCRTKNDFSEELQKSLRDLPVKLENFAEVF